MRKIAFDYMPFKKNNGGASIHGFYLHKFLEHRYEVVIIREQKYLLNKIKNYYSADLVYVRVNFINIFKLLFIQLLSNNIIVELNAPPDELLLKKIPKFIVLLYDKIFKTLLRIPKHIIVVSEELELYCNKYLGLNNISVVHNGGEKYIDKKINYTEIENVLLDMKRKYKRIAVWSGTSFPNQDFSKIKEIIDSSDDIGFIIISNDSKVFEDVKEKNNVHFFKRLERDEICYILSKVDIGLALYGDYSWSRLGFYNSSLKFFEYLANDLCIIGTPIGHLERYGSPKYCNNESLISIKTFMENCDIESKSDYIRTWDDVGNDVNNVILKYLGEDEN